MLRRVLLAGALILAACAQANDNPGPVADSVHQMATLPPVAWIQPADTITLDNVSQIQLLGRLDNPTTPSTIFDHALSPDGTLLAGLDHEQIIVWDLITGQTVFNLERREEITRIFFSADKTELYAVELSGLVTVYAADTGRERTTFRGIDEYDGVLTYDPEGSVLAFANRKGEVRIWDPLERQALATFTAYDRPVQRLAFSHDGDRLATADSFGAVTIWDWRSRSALAPLENEQPALRLEFAPDDSLLAVGSPQDIRLWSSADGTLQRRLSTGPDAMDLLAFSPDGAQTVNGGETPDMQVWDVQTGSLIARLPGVGEDRLAAAYSPDGGLLLTAELGGSVSLWNMTAMTENTVNRADLDTGSARIYAVDWTSDGLLLTLFGATGSVYVWGIPPQADPGS
ncbi:MAG: hypothetical protein K8J31_02205 [Anaerolineae bacterium]|nr:hypothetical protein [Anaerolineae bacterium]